MPGSVTSVFGEAENFEAALREEGFTGLLVTEAGAGAVVKSAKAVAPEPVKAAEPTATWQGSAPVNRPID